MTVIIIYRWTRLQIANLGEGYSVYVEFLLVYMFFFLLNIFIYK